MEKTSFLKKTMIKKILRSQYFSLSGLAILIVTFAILVNMKNPSFLSATNIVNIIRQVVVYGILAFAVSFPMINGTFDLSNSSIAALCGMLAALMTTETGLFGIHLPLFAALLVTIAVGALIGFITGFLVTHTNINAFIITLSTQTAIRGCVYLVSGNMPIGNLPSGFMYIGFGKILGIPISIYILIIIFILVWFVFSRTKFGRSIYAVGGNYQAAYQSGIKVVKIRTSVYIIMGVLAAIAGIILTARSGSAQPTAANGYEGTAVSACAVGGVALSGGQGTVLGILMGAIMMGMITNGMNLMQISSNWQYVVKGLLIIGSVLYSQWISGLTTKLAK